MDLMEEGFKVGFVYGRVDIVGILERKDDSKDRKKLPVPYLHR